MSVRVRTEMGDRMADGMAEAAMAEACALLGTGCREVAEPGGVRLDFWLDPAAAPSPEVVRAWLARAGHAAEVSAAPERSDWQAALRAFHQPVEVAGRLWLRPPWVEARAGLLDVAIDPGMAFGTGQHATTRGCLELLADLPPGPLLDVGCGSGVLSIAARRLGFDPVWAIDHDPLAVSATLANARRNRVGLRVGRRSLGTDRLPAAPTVTANLSVSLLPALAGALGPGPPERLVASGLRAHEAPAAEAALAPLGLRRARAIEREGWVTLLLARGGEAGV